MPVPVELYTAVFDERGVLAEDLRRSSTLATFSTFNHHIIGFNTGRVPDIHLRRAMSYGTNREEIASKLLSGLAEVTGGVIPPSMHGYRPAVDAESYRPELAKAELELSDYDGSPIEMLVHDLANSESVGEVFQQQMRSIGVNISLTKLDYGSVIGRAIQGDAEAFSLYAEIVFSSPEPLLISLFSSGKIPVPNFWKYSEPEVDQQLEELRTTFNVDERLAASSEVERRIVEDVPAIFLYSEVHALLVSQRVSNIVINPHEHYQLELARIEQ